jgi:hypothetical protein
MRTPPYLPTKMLERLASGPRRGSLIGDLTEAYRNGRSAAWYWRQALTAIVADVNQSLRIPMKPAMATRCSWPELGGVAPSSRKESGHLRYSSLNTTFGSSRDARHAGNPQATVATSVIVAITTASVVPSVGRTPNSSDAIQDVVVDALCLVGRRS